MRELRVVPAMKQLVFAVWVLCAPWASGTDALLTESPFHAVIQRESWKGARSSSTSYANQVLLQENGHDALVLRLHLIRHAVHTIDIQTFIWSNDECARLVQYELEQAARRGVTIRVLVDYMGWSPGFNPTPGQGAEPIELRVYRPPLSLAKSILPHHLVDSILPRGTNQRMHLKTIIVDGAIGITGGRNFDNHYFNRSTTYNFKDRDAVVIGPAVDDMAKCFNAYWRFKKTVRTDKTSPLSALVPRTPGVPLTADDVGLTTWFQNVDAQADDAAYVEAAFVAPMRRVGELEFIWDEPGKKTRLPYINPLGGGAVTKRLNEAFHEAETSIVIQSPYVIVNRRSRRPFQKTLNEHKNLHVSVSTNSFGAADHLITYAANFRLRPQVVGRLGFEVHEYKPHPEDLLVHLSNYEALRVRAEQARERRPPYLSIHAKSYVIDGDTAFVGSYNLDPRSFYYNSECGVMIRDRGVAQILEQTIQRDMEAGNSWVIARRPTPLGDLNVLLEGLSSIAPVDIWPVRNTSSFELRPGAEPCHVDHPEFYTRYRDIGSFPGAETVDFDQILTRFFKITGKVATPML